MVPRRAASATTAHCWVYSTSTVVPTEVVKQNDATKVLVVGDTRDAGSRSPATRVHFLSATFLL